MRKLTLNEVIIRFKAKHGNFYDYSKVIYTGKQNKVKIICPIHGEFEQIAESHWNGCKCQKCELENKVHSTNTFIKQANIVHENKYDYSKVEYITSKDPVIIICPNHGEFLQTPNQHLQGYGCKKCGWAIISKQEFINRSNKLHNNQYDYSKVNYVNSRTKVEIICPKHGSFWQTPHNHMGKTGCPRCKETFGEKLIQTLISENFPLVKYSLQKHTNWSKKQSFDLYLDDYNIAIEYDGIQHFQPIDYFGGEQQFIKVQQLDLQKNQLCLENNCKLFRIRYDYTQEDLDDLIEELSSIINSSD